MWRKGGTCIHGYLHKLRGKSATCIGTNYQKVVKMGDRALLIAQTKD